MMRPGKTVLPVLAALVALVALPQLHATAADEDELRRTWEAAWVYAPAATSTGYRRIDPAALFSYLASSRTGPPAVVLYAHGCDGLSDISAASGRFLAQAGYLFIAPDSFARRRKPASCRPARHLGGLHRAVLGWRQAEMRNAFARIGAVPALAGVPLVLMGHSEGAIAVATLDGVPAAGRIIEGWTCHAGWPEYRGLHAPPGQPVLALVGEDDPWFETPVLSGDCGAFMDDEAPQRSIVYRRPNYLAGNHWLSFDGEVQKIILAFIRNVARPEGRSN